MKRHYENLTNLEIDEKLMKEAKNIWREEYEDSDWLYQFERKENSGKIISHITHKFDI